MKRKTVKKSRDKANQIKPRMVVGGQGEKTSVRLCVA